jgi:hypothetical protein
MKKTIIAAAILFASCTALATESHKDRSHKPRGEKQATATQVTDVNQAAQAGASSRAGAISGATAAGGSGRHSTASATGGAGGNSSSSGAQKNKKSPLIAFIAERAAAQQITIESYASSANSQMITIQASARNQEQLTQFQKDITQSSFGAQATIPLTSIKATNQGVSCTISVSIQSAN